MKIISSIGEMESYSRDARQKKQKIGFVPTMGAFHEGHLSLMRAAEKECDIVIVSVFVNRLQFSPNEDFDKYPRDMEQDKKLAEAAGVSVLFAPTADEMYPEDFSTHVEVTARCARSLCAKRRVGHFKGVTTVLAKLFNICRPNEAYFGQKDAQQAVIVKKMVRDLNLPITVQVMSIVREKDGLAMSSRNAYLSPEERVQATALYGALKEARNIIGAGEISAARVKNKIEQILKKEKKLKIDYVEIVNAETLESVDRIDSNTLIAIAVFVGETRLIDNIMVSRATANL
ncbi:MAG: pantoate--beta-alanine ligase [Candidatus Omnitrophica bacterium]|nr:pantoate--beta-alanine ligase [Candidatus Omnitrophota bacterium]